MEKQEGWTKEEAIEQKSMQEQVDKAISAMPLNLEPLDVINRRRAKVRLPPISQAMYEAAQKGQ